MQHSSINMHLQILIILIVFFDNFETMASYVMTWYYKGDTYKNHYKTGARLNMNIFADDTRTTSTS